MTTVLSVGNAMQSVTLIYDGKKVDEVETPERRAPPVYSQKASLAGK